VLSQESGSIILKPEAMEFGARPVQPTAALDRPIDPSTYVVGPGDKVSIFIWGNIQAQYNLSVSPEGKILVPTVGPIEVSGLTLAEAKQAIEKYVLERLRNVAVATELTDLRTFRVSIGGAINSPGIYAANAVTRVSEIISVAGGFVGEDEQLNWQSPDAKPITFPSGVASHRRILVTHHAGEVDTADVLLFEHAGDLRYNFRVLDGDEILVPVRESQIYLYGIFGGVKSPAYYEYSSRDSLKDLINLGHGLTLDADSSVAELVRFGPDGKTVSRTTVGLKEIVRGLSQDIKLRPDDRVYIKSIKDYNEKSQVLVQGEVRHPGFYAIKPDSTYLSQVVLETGGFTELASLEEAVMTRVRVTFRDEDDPEYARLKQMNVQDMNELEYEYFKVKSREKAGRVSVNFNQLFADRDNGDIKLRDGDIITIPRKSDVINVVGEVARPGLLSHKPGYDYLDYVDLAGGFSFRADKGKVRIISGTTGEWKKSRHGTKIYAGDTILVPEKGKSQFFATLKDVMAFAANAATVYLVIREATR